MIHTGTYQYVPVQHDIWLTKGHANLPGPAGPGARASESPCSGPGRWLQVHSANNQASFSYVQNNMAAALQMLEADWQT